MRANCRLPRLLVSYTRDGSMDKFIGDSTLYIFLDIFFLLISICMFC